MAGLYRSLLVEITGDYWRLREITGDYRRLLLEIAGDYWSLRLLDTTYRRFITSAPFTTGAQLMPFSMIGASRISLTSCNESNRITY